jgi:hypothetical protein
MQKIKTFHQGLHMCGSDGVSKQSGPSMDTQFNSWVEGEVQEGRMIEVINLFQSSAASGSSAVVTLTVLYTVTEI